MFPAFEAVAETRMPGEKNRPGRLSSPGNRWIILCNTQWPEEKLNFFIIPVTGKGMVSFHEHETKSDCIQGRYIFSHK